MASPTHTNSPHLIQLQEVTSTGVVIGKGSYGRVIEVYVHGTLCAAKEVHPILVNGTFDHHRFGRDFSLNLQRKFLLLLCLWRGLGHKLLHAKFQTCSFLNLAAGAAKLLVRMFSILGQKYVLSVEWHCL